MTYSCIECVDRPAFPSIPSLARHRNTAHPVRPLPKEPTPMPTETTGTLCPDCHATFRNEHGLAVHRRRAHGHLTTRPSKRTDTVDLAIAPVRRRLTTIEATLADHDALIAERDRLTRLLDTLEAAR